MNAKELEKLTICRRCPDQQRCGVWADFVNSEDREEMEKELATAEKTFDKIGKILYNEDKAK